ncbi:hypothetical protein SISNIDRAFT_406885, partial [Sistotremastrum niveocremeum HHB9708]
GKIELPPLQQPPDVLHELLTSNTPTSKKFRSHIRQYNAAFAFTSLGVSLDESLFQGTGAYAFRIHGQLAHRTGSLLPAAGQPIRYAQIYIIDSSEERVEARRQGNLNAQRGRRPANANDFVDADVWRELETMIEENHRFFGVYKQAYQIMREKPVEEQRDLQVHLRFKKHTDRRRYNLPNVAEGEIAAIIPGPGNIAHDSRDIVLRLNDGPLSRISDRHPAYHPLHYVLLFPYGEMGWHEEIPLAGENEAGRYKKVTRLMFMQHRLHTRFDQPASIFYACKLFHQYIVDGWACIEQSDLMFLRTHQNQLRRESYRGLADALNANDERDTADIGQPIILPSSFINSPCCMMQLFQDAMSICRYYLHPDLFITMTLLKKLDLLIVLLSTF